MYQFTTQLAGLSTKESGLLLVRRVSSSWLPFSPMLLDEIKLSKVIVVSTFILSIMSQTIL